jgi:hypothetical protein
MATKNSVCIFIFIFCLQIIKSNAKCVMYDTCSNKTFFNLNSESPTKGRWMNCYVDHIEPKRLDNKIQDDLFKKLCPMMHEYHDSPVCCSFNQLLILEHDIVAAKAVIGPCPSCYLNFRTMWCNLACNPNQADFIYVEKTENKPFLNFSYAYNLYNEYVRKMQIDEYENYDEDESGNIKDNDNLSVDDIIEYPQTDNNTISKRSTENKPMTSNVVAQIRYFIREEFMLGTIDSCRYVKSGHLIDHLKIKRKKSIHHMNFEAI